MKPGTRSTRSLSRQLAGIAAGVLVAAVCLVLLPQTAVSAKTTPGAVTSTTCDEAYGCNTSTTQTPPPTTCNLNTTVVTAGDTVTATVSNVAVGTQIEITFNGATVATGTAVSDGQGSGGATISFRVPANTAAGKYDVRAIGTGFNADCASGAGGLQVLAAAVSNAGGGGSLSRTGIEVGMYLAVALVLLLVGWQLVMRARARTRRIAQRRRPSHSVRH
jgi:hypothetical protein